MRHALVAAMVVAATAAVAQESPRKAEIRGKLDAMKVSLDFKATPLEDAIGYLRDLTGIDFLVDSDVRTKLSEDELRITFQVRDVSLRSALKLMLGTRELTATYREGVLLVQSKEKAAAATTLQMYDVRDLQLKLPDFAGPNVDLQKKESGCIIVILPDEPVSSLGDDLILDLVKSSTGDRSWDDNPATGIQLANGALVVSQSKRVHEDIRRLLDRLRGMK